MTTVTIKTEHSECTISEEAIVLDDVLDMCKRALNGIGFNCKSLEQKEEELDGYFAKPDGE